VDNPMKLHQKIQNKLGPVQLGVPHQGLGCEIFYEELDAEQCNLLDHV
jgi:hypothetical protein